MICSIDDLLKETVALSPKKPAVKDGNVIYDYQRLAQAVDRVGHDLCVQGVHRGDRVGIYMKKSIAQVIAIFAVSRGQGVFVIVNSKLKAEQVKHIVQDCQIKLLITDPRGKACLSGEGWFGEIDSCVLSVDARGSVSVFELKQGELREKSSFAEQQRIRRDLAALIYTSGSTGKPKGVMLSHGNLLSGTESVVSYLHINEQDRIISVLPFSFDYGLNQLLCAVKAKCLFVLCRFIFPQEIGRIIKRDQITVVAGIPGLWSLMFHGVHGICSEGPFRSVRCITNSGGQVSPQVIAKMQTVFPEAEVFLMYGLTEAFRSTFLDPDQIGNRPNSIGKAVPNAEVILVNDRGERVEPGEIGEIVHRGDTVALGYWDNPEETARVFRSNPFSRAEGSLTDGAVFSGDYAKCDEEGYLYFVGRKDHQIKVSGMRVSPEEIESIIVELDAVLEAAVVGIRSETGDDRIAAFITKDGKIDRVRVIRHCRKRLPQYMVPSEVIFCETLPRLPSGKTDKGALKKHRISSSHEAVPEEREFLHEKFAESASSQGSS